MSTLYDRIEGLCKIKNTNITQMCKEAGVSRSILSDYKAGRSKSITVDNLEKIASYLNCSVDYLLGKTDQKKPPEKSKGVSEEDLKVALFHGADDVTDEMWEEAKRYALYLKERKKKKGENSL